MSGTPPDTKLAPLVAHLHRLDAALERFACVVEPFGIAPSRDAAWWTLLRQKLLPQLTSNPFLIVAIIGGTNVGKSLLFNHLVGESLSCVDVHAAGTKHPVCAVSPSLGTDENIAAALAQHFASFHLAAWDAAESPLRDDLPPTLFWRTCETVPSRLVILDTPDIDSDAAAHWERAAVVRQAADVVIAVLTPEKYNDAATKRFFRETAAAGKIVLPLFNRVTSEDRPHLAAWCRQFCRDTSLAAQSILPAVAVQWDRAAAVTRTLPFQKITQEITSDTHVDLRERLAALHFDKIRSRTLRGSLDRLLNAANGIPAYLASVRDLAESYTAARELLVRPTCSEWEVAWTSLPIAVLQAEVDRWWDERRPAWSRGIHRIYRIVGHAVSETLVAVPRLLSGASLRAERDARTDIVASEGKAVVAIIEQTLERLRQLQLSGCAVLSAEIAPLLTGAFRERLLRDAQQFRESLPTISDSFHTMLRRDLTAWAEEFPNAVKRREFLDSAMAVARPIATATFIVTGCVGAAAVFHSAFLGVPSLVTTIGGVAVGETLMHQSQQRSVMAFARLFEDALKAWTTERASLFDAWLNERLWRDVATRIEHGEALSQHKDIATIFSCLQVIATSSFMTDTHEMSCIS